METHKSPFNRNLPLILVALYLLTIVIFVYPVLAAEPNLPEWWMILINMLLLSIPLLLLYGSLYVLIRDWHECPRLSLRWESELKPVTSSM